jgi:hypothetical protein
MLHAEANPEDEIRLARLLLQLSETDGDFICKLCGRARARRDEVIRQARAMYPGSLRSCAEAFARDLLHYAAGAWLREKHTGLSGTASPQRRFHFRVAYLNEGAALSGRHIARIWE